MNTDLYNRTLTLKEVAAYMKRRPSYVKALIKDGKLPSDDGEAVRLVDVEAFVRHEHKRKFKDVADEL